MRRYGGAAIPMQQSLAKAPEGIRYLVGNREILEHMERSIPKKPFADDVLDFLNEVSRAVMADPRARQYSDVVTFAFWIRKGSTSKLREQYIQKDGNIRLGRGVAFHIAPSNVPVNYAYSLVTGLLCGNANVVRIPSKAFPQVEIINNAIQKVLDLDAYRHMQDYICLIRYGREQAINDYLSQICDVRVIWGGDGTIAEIRKSPLKPRAGEITFADRFSIAVIDSGAYMSLADKHRTAEDFYNDTYFSDQNACTSPRIVVWTGSKIAEAKQIFWEELHAVVARKYQFQSIQAVNKLTSAYLLAATHSGITVVPHADNLIVRCVLQTLPEDLMDCKDNSGYFFEYDCADIMELRTLCNDTRCQTVACIGDTEMLKPLLETGVKGIDRVVPVGKTMDFDLVWDGYQLCERMTRILRLS